MDRYVALLRGINVGGNNLIKMIDLRACFEKAGFERVATYIQSGNVAFTSRRSGADKLARRIEEALVRTFACEASVTVRSWEQMCAIVEGAPKGFGEQPAKFRYDVIYLRAPLAAPEALKSVVTKAGVDEARAGDGVLYFSRRISRASQSRLGKIVSSPIYRSVTIRNWRTTNALLRLLDESQQASPSTATAD